MVICAKELDAAVLCLQPHDVDNAGKCTTPFIDLLWFGGSSHPFPRQSCRSLATVLRKWSTSSTGTLSCMRPSMETASSNQVRRPFAHLATYLLIAMHKPKACTCSSCFGVRGLKFLLVLNNDVTDLALGRVCYSVARSSPLLCAMGKLGVIPSFLTRPLVML